MGRRRSDTASAALRALLEHGLAQGLFSGAAAAVSNRDLSAVAYVGTHAEDDPTPVGPGSRFDLASVTKSFTAAALVRLAELGRLSLDEPVAPVLPVATGAGAEDITLRMLLNHTSGLPAETFVWRDLSMPVPDRLPRVLATPLESRPGTTFEYSCVGYVAAAAVAARVTGSGLADLVREHLLTPIGTEAVGFGPLDPAVAVATEDESYVGRGVVRGEVHDELSWFLGGVTGNAGLFGTAEGVLAFAEAFVDGTLLGREGLALMTPVVGDWTAQEFRPTVGLRYRDREFMGSVAGYGHPGFTGTMWFVVPEQQLSVVLLTNSVHPQRGRVDLGPFQRGFSERVAELGRTLARPIDRPASARR